MKNENKLKPFSLENLFLSFFGVGHIPFAPGTFGTLACLPFLATLGLVGFPPLFILPFFFITLAGACYITHVVQKNLKLEDPSWIVIDEVLGMIVAWIFIQEHSLLHYTVLFVLFRFFDIVKVWPANYVDKNIKSGIGTILDDVVSGIYAGLLYYILTLFNLF